MKFIIKLDMTWDPEAQVYVGSSDNLKSLVTSAPTVSGLIDRVLEVAPQLLWAEAEIAQEIKMAEIDAIGVETNLRRYDEARLTA